MNDTERHLIKFLYLDFPDIELIEVPDEITYGNDILNFSKGLLNWLSLSGATIGVMGSYIIDNKCYTSDEVINEYIKSRLIRQSSFL